MSTHQTRWSPQNQLLTVALLICLWTLVSSAFPIKKNVAPPNSIAIPLDVLGFGVAFLLWRKLPIARAAARLFLAYWMFVEFILLVADDPTLDNDWIRSLPFPLLRVLWAVMLLIQMWQAKVLASKDIDELFTASN